MDIKKINLKIKSKQELYELVDFEYKLPDINASCVTIEYLNKYFTP